MQLPKKPGLAEINKYHIAYTILILAALVYLFSHGFIDQSGGRNDDCHVQLDKIEEEKRIVDSAYKATLFELALKNEVIEQIPKAVDSSIGGHKKKK